MQKILLDIPGNHPSHPAVQALLDEMEKQRKTSKAKHKRIMERVFQDALEGESECDVQEQRLAVKSSSELCNILSECMKMKDGKVSMSQMGVIKALGKQRVEQIVDGINEEYGTGDDEAFEILFRGFRFD